MCLLLTCGFVLFGLHVFGCGLDYFAVVLWLKQIVACLCGFTDDWCSVLLWFALWLGLGRVAFFGQCWFCCSLFSFSDGFGCGYLIVYWMMPVMVY